MNKTIAFVMFAILFTVLPFMWVNYGASAHEQGGWLSEKSTFVNVGVTESFLFPLCVWYLMFCIVNFIPENEIKKTRGKVEPR